MCIRDRHTAGRMTAVASANARETESYAEARIDVEDAVVNARGDIEELKTNLDSARLERQHKEEYEALRRLCMQYPSRATTEAANAQLASEIGTLEADGEATARKLELRKKQFALLLHAVNQLQDELDDEEKEVAVVAADDDDAEDEDEDEEEGAVPTAMDTE